MMDKKVKLSQASSLSRREFLKLSGLFAGAAALAACTGGPATNVPAVTSTKAAFKGELEVWDWEFPVRQTLVNELIDDWKTKRPEITIKYLSLPWADIETKILAVSSAKNGPPVSDVFGFWRYDLQRAGVIVPFPDDFADWNDRLSTPFMRDENNKIRAFPSGWYCDMVYYNKEMFDKEGYKASDIPTKWEDFIKFSKEITQIDKEGKITRAGCAMNDYWQHEYLWQGLIYQQGAWMYSEDGTKALWEDEPGVKALQFIKDWYNTHKIADPALADGYAGFCNDQAIMFLGSGWNTGYFMNDFPQMAGRWDTVKIPTFSGTGDPAYGIATPEENFQAFGNYPEEEIAAGFDFIKHLMAGEDRYLRWAQAQSCAPDSKKLISDARIAAITGVPAMAETLPKRVWFGERPLEAEKLWRTMFDQVILQNGDVKAALKEATTAINQALPSKKRYFTERNYKSA